MLASDVEGRGSEKKEEFGVIMTKGKALLVKRYRIFLEE